MSAIPRLSRMFGTDGKCFDVAVDHGFFGERAFLTDIEHMPKVIQTLADANPDAIQLTVGQAMHLQSIPGKLKPALVLRTDVANVYGKAPPAHLFSRMIAEPVEQALRLDAASVCVNLFLLPNQPKVYEACIEHICALKPQCVRYGMPLMVEPLVMKDSVNAGGYVVDGDLDKIMTLVRQAVELGADVIKADPCENIGLYYKVVEVASGKPILVRGGGRVPNTEILQRTYDLMQQGVQGIVYGRNVIQHHSPVAMTRALMSIVHEGATPEQAAKFLE